ncbi:MAG: hypothetical protein AB7D02_02305 [Candidatus Paceibacterota bacterium]
MKNKKIFLYFLTVVFLLGLFIFLKNVKAQNELIGEFSFTPSGEGFLIKWSAPEANFCFPLGEMWTNKFSSSGQQMVYPQYPTTYSLYCFNSRLKNYQVKSLTITEADLKPKIELVAIPEKASQTGETVFLMLYILRKGDIKYCSAIDFYKYWQTKVGAQEFLKLQKVDIEKTGFSAMVRPNGTTDYVVECYNEKGELRARDVARVTERFSKYKSGIMQAIRNGNQVNISWQVPSSYGATYCLFTRGSDVVNTYLVNPSGAVTFDLPSNENDFFTLDCYNASDYLVVQTDAYPQEAPTTSCVPQGEYVVYDPRLGDVNQKCCPGLQEVKLNEYFGYCK